MTANRRLLLMSTGMAAVLFYVLHVILGGFLWQGYSHLHQPISDLTATGAPHRALMLVITTLYGILAVTFAFSFTVLESRKHRKLVFWGGIFFIILHIISLLYGLFPEDLPGQAMTFQGSMHILITALIVPCTILTPFFIGFGLLKDPGWKTFGYFSVITGCLICVFGTLTGVFYANGHPYFGLVERLNIGTLELWTFCFSLKLIRAK